MRYFILSCPNPEAVVASFVARDLATWREEIAKISYAGRHYVAADIMRNGTPVLLSGDEPDPYASQPVITTALGDDGAAAAGPTWARIVDATHWTYTLTTLPLTRAGWKKSDLKPFAPRITEREHAAPLYRLPSAA